MQAEPATIAAAVERVRERIARAAARCGRPVSDIRLVAVTKTKSAGVLREAYLAGVRHFGENRVQEWEAKQPLLADLDGAVFHMIGHLQRNKARRAVALFHRVDSVDSLALARRLDEYAGEAGRVVPVLIEVRLSEETDKSGIEPEALELLARSVDALTHLDLRGLMTVPPWSEDPEPARPYFRRLRDLREGLERNLRHELPVLSMGMTNDLDVAIEEGATEVRVGTAIFGRRPKLE